LTNRIKDIILYLKYKKFRRKKLFDRRIEGKAEKRRRNKYGLNLF